MERPSNWLGGEGGREKGKEGGEGGRGEGEGREGEGREGEGRERGRRRGEEGQKGGASDCSENTEEMRVKIFPPLIHLHVHGHVFPNLYNTVYYHLRKLIFL